MATLSEIEKHELVTLLAQFKRPADVVVHMRRQFSVEIDRFQIRSYDPTNPRYEGGARWRPIFDAAREAYLSSIEAIPIAHKGYRLNTLQRILDVALRRGDVAFAASILVQAAKEVGPVSRKMTFSSPARPQAFRSPEARQATIAEICGKLLPRWEGDLPPGRR